jgi:1,4-alpha-glucan branching enzyme
MIEVESIFGTAIKKHQYVTYQKEDDKVIVYERGELVYIFNFHPNNSYTDYLIGTHWRSDHMILIETDEERFGGHQRLNDGHNKWMKVDEKGWAERRHSLKVYIPSRCAIILAPFEFAHKYPEVKMPDYNKEDPHFKQFITSPSKEVSTKTQAAPSQS